MERESNDALKIVLSIAALIIVSVVAFFILNQSTSAAKQKGKEVTDFATTAAESNYTDYEGQIVQGSQVLSLLRTYANHEIRIEVDGTSFNYTDNTLTTKSTNTAGKATRRDSGYYISPSANYECTIERADDGTNEIRAMVFTLVP